MGAVLRAAVGFLALCQPVHLAFVAVSLQKLVGRVWGLPDSALMD